MPRAVGSGVVQCAREPMARPRLRTGRGATGDLTLCECLGAGGQWQAQGSVCVDAMGEEEVGLLTGAAWPTPAQDDQYQLALHWLREVPRRLRPCSRPLY